MARSMRSMRSAISVCSAALPKRPASTKRSRSARSRMAFVAMSATRKGETRTIRASSHPPGIAEAVNEVDEALILFAARAHGCIDVGRIAPADRRDGLRRDSREVPHPEAGLVVHPRLPRVQRRDETRAFRITRTRPPAMIGQQLRIDRCGSGIGGGAVLRSFPDLARGDGEDRGLGDAGGRWRSVDAPHVRSWEVIV